MSTSNGNPWVDNIERSCAVLYFHFFWGIFMVILGWTTLAARYVEQIKPYHRLMGQIWVYGMIVQIYSSTYCRRDGFRWFIFMFGVFCYGGIIIGHTFIRKFQREKSKINLSKDYNDDAYFIDINLVKVWRVNMLTIKRIHGINMFIALIMVTGAGAAFTKRFADVGSCTNIYSPA